MDSFETITTVSDTGEVSVKDTPFEPGQKVQVEVRPELTASERAKAAEEFKAFIKEIQKLPHIQKLTEEDIAEEIRAHREGR